MLDWWYKENHRPADYKPERVAWYWVASLVLAGVLLPLFIWFCNAHPIIYFIVMVIVVSYAFFLKEPKDSVSKQEEWWRGNVPIWNMGGWKRELKLRWEK